MKKNLLIIFFILLCGIHSYSIPEEEDRKEVFRICLSLSELQNYFTLNEGSERIINIRQYPISFSLQMADDINNCEIHFYSMEEIESQGKNEFLVFREFNIDNSSASVTINYFYDYDHTKNVFKMLVLKIGMEKNGTSWIVTNLKQEGDIK